MDKTLLNQGLRRALLAMPLMFLGPSVIHNAWINKDKWQHYIVLAVGLLLCGLAVYLMFSGIRIMLKSMFDHENES